MGAQRAGRIVHAAVDHFAVARRHALPMPLVCSATMTSCPFRSGSARHRKPHHTGADDKNLHDLRFQTSFPVRQSNHRWMNADEQLERKSNIELPDDLRKGTKNQCRAFVLVATWELKKMFSF